MADEKDLTHLPVLEIGINVDNAGDGWVASPADRNPTLTAKAVPDALWEDDSFREAVLQRRRSMSVFAAIAAELTHRLQPEVDA
jgi:hypothetical protein